MATAKTVKAKSPVELTETGNRFFWVSVFLSEIQMLDELDAVHREMMRRNRPEVTTLALCGAAVQQRSKVRQTIDACMRAGVLLFCFDGTTALQGGAA